MRRSEVTETSAPNAENACVANPTDRLDRRTDGKGESDPYSLIVATNFGFHFGSVDGVQAPIEFGLLPARRPAVTIVMMAITDYAKTGEGNCAWELAQLREAGRLGTVTFIDEGVVVKNNPFQ